MTAWCALLNGESTSKATAELTALSAHVGVHRVQKSGRGGSMGTLSALATALAPLVWPDRFANLPRAIELFNDGKQVSACKLHYSSVNRLVTALGGSDRVRSAVIEHQANTAMNALAAASAIVPTVSVVIGTTGQSARPIMLRLFVVSRSELSNESAAASSSATLLSLIHI